MQSSKGSDDSLSEKVLLAYRTAGHRHTGATFDQVLNALTIGGTRITMDQLVRTVESLANDGHLYSTVDELHYHPTDMM